MLKIIIMAGTRPEAIKVAPVAHILKNMIGINSVLCNTGQHREMITQAFEDFHLIPDIELEVMRSNQSLAGLTARLMEGIDEILMKEKPDWVLVQGDTMTVMAASLCAFYRGIKIGHIEAGLRTYKKYSPFPEEVNRQIVTRVADLHFAPTQQARENLLRDGISKVDIVLTGNTVVDALQFMQKEVNGKSGLLLPEVEAFLDAGKQLIIVTGHRRENFGETFEGICNALARIVRENENAFILYPVHLNPNVREPVQRLLGKCERVILSEPMRYMQFIAHLSASYLVLTDSGGIQEEVPSLRKPVLVMRNDTERPEGVAAGVAILTGTVEEDIVNHTSRLLNDRCIYKKIATATNPYGDGHASKRIIDAIIERYHA